jgi:tmRNA-binding protein
MLLVLSKSSPWYCTFLPNRSALKQRLISHSISITGFVVLGGNVKSIPDPGANFRDSFAGATGDASGVVRAIVRVNYAYEGWSNSFNVVNEIKVCLLLWYQGSADQNY